MEVALAWPRASPTQSSVYGARRPPLDLDLIPAGGGTLYQTEVWASDLRDGFVLEGAVAAAERSAMPPME
jgi:hypothetical protein